MNSELNLNEKIANIIMPELGPYGSNPLILEMIKFLLKGVYEGLILINNEGRIEFMDKGSEKFFNLDRGGAKNVFITDIIPDAKLHIVLKTGEPEIGKIQKLKGKEKIVSRLPIKKNGEIIGAIGKVIFHRLDEIERLNNEIEKLKIKIKNYKDKIRDMYSAHYTFENLIGISEKFLKTKEIAMRAAQTEANILLEGESGVGKELFAHSIHNFSKRSNNPFIRVNCPSIPFELAESELFGYEKGAFSGARIEGKKGKFELSEGGTIFLDEIACLPLTIQAKLLRVIQEKEIERLGGKGPLKIDFRLIAATNQNLLELVKKGHFRDDLFYRLNTISIKIPSLRERREDIPIYIDHFLKEINKRLGINIKGISEEALEIMMNYTWPGNVRELANVLEQSAMNGINCQKILIENLPDYILKNTNVFIPRKINNLKKILEDAEKEAIKKALNLTLGNKRKAAKILEIHRCSLYQKLKKYPDLNQFKN